MTWPQPTRKDHECFCVTEGWHRVRDARGRAGTHHATYELDLPDGSILRTRISHPVDRSGYGKGLWAHILRDQLGVSDEEFWACVRDGQKPDRGAPPPVKDSLPAEMVRLLITRVGISEKEVAEMSREQAIIRLQQYWLDCI
ncbi:cytotoxic translational repressor of toxin-antitoxin stability system [Actinoallomurus soli]|uniref:cytotoxic translational repressor of toxin-antitoxin stability system n=1 Tax=Actinoallomurus soli TaxID=2952535 RepID=UPI0020930BCB|nr:cytotoxic translational repressor of toxin-antitoxin stability system [Actinoallomurus soli]MCO5974803.1 cytotoxic translational repressor of toxin-antitoxin stability system [Actinoallomurus soli]